jgi:hypothetical protein
MSTESAVITDEIRKLVKWSQEAAAEERALLILKPGDHWPMGPTMVADRIECLRVRQADLALNLMTVVSAVIADEAVDEADYASTPSPQERP